MTSFQIMTLEGWSDVMYVLQRGVNGTLGTVYCVGFVVLGPFCVLNLFLAVLFDSYGRQLPKSRRQELRGEMRGVAAAHTATSPTPPPSPPPSPPVYGGGMPAWRLGGGGGPAGGVPVLPAARRGVPTAAVLPPPLLPPPLLALPLAPLLPVLAASGLPPVMPSAPSVPCLLLDGGTGGGTPDFFECFAR